MRRLMLIIASLIVVMASTGLGLAETYNNPWWSFPKEVPPQDYGNVVIDRLSSVNNVKPVVFSHWRHRLKYTCRVCHFELGFEFKRNTTEITEKDSRMGYFCGACHNGSEVFDHTSDNCDKCHSGKRQYSSLDFKRVWNALPPAKYGNEIDWVRSARKLSREYSIFYSESPMKYKKKLVLEAELSNIPPVYFPHKSHVRELACSNCHPEPFNIRKKTTEHFTMEKILDGKFCGVCHMNVAFPMKDCKRCHPGIKRDT